MKKILPLISLVLLTSTSMFASDNNDNDNSNNGADNSLVSPTVESENIAGILFDSMNERGEFGNVDQETLDYAKIVVQNIASDPQLLRQFENGELTLNEQTIGDYFLLDTVKSVGGKIVDVGSKAFGAVKGLASGIASLANRALTAVTSSDVVMKFIGGVTSVVNKLIPFASTAIGAALLLVPGGEVLIPIVAAVTPVLMKVVTPDNVTKALEIGAAVASVADQFINEGKKQKGNRAPSSDLITLEKKPKKPSSKDRDTAGNAYKLALDGYNALTKYVNKLGKKGWEKLAKKDREKLTKALNKGAALLAMVDPNKLK